MLQVVGNKLLIKPDEIEKEVDLNGKKFVIVQDEKREKAAQRLGTIVEVGHAAWFDFPTDLRGWVSVGDRVIYQRHAGTFVVDPDTEEEYVIVNDNDVHCIVKETVKKEEK